MNTVEAEQTAETAIDSANLLINSNLDFVFVEGATDVDFLSRFIDPSRTIVLPAGSKGGLKRIRKSTEILSDDYICVCDQDYEQRIEDDKKWFYYDFANQEMMILHGNNSWDLISKILSIDIDTLISLRDASLIKLRIITAIRCHYRNNLLPFAITDYLEHNYALCASNIDSFNECICKKMNECGVCLETIKEIEEHSTQIKYDDLKNLTNGHDAMEVIFVSLLDYVKNIKYNGIIGCSDMIYTKKHFVPLLQKLYLESDFKRSSMYQKINLIYGFTDHTFFI